jgi:hypothetical protein
MIRVLLADDQPLVRAGRPEDRGADLKPSSPSSPLFNKDAAGRVPRRHSCVARRRPSRHRAQRLTSSVAVRGYVRGRTSKASARPTPRGFRSRTMESERSERDEREWNT